MLTGCTSDPGGTGPTTIATPPTPVTASATTALPTSVPPVPEGPGGEAFFVPPDPLPGVRPGDPIWTRTLDAPDGAAGAIVLYRSETLDGRAIAGSGVVLSPDGG